MLSSQARARFLWKDVMLLGQELTICKILFNSVDGFFLLLLLKGQ